MSPISVNFPENLNISPSIYPTHDSHSIHINEKVFGDVAQREAIDKYGIAGRVWEASYFLSRYVDPVSNIVFDPPFVAPYNSTLVILELGSGAGLATSRIAEILNNKDILIATDLPEVCPLLEANVKASRPLSECSVFVRPLAWGNHGHGTTLASELLVTPYGSASLTHVVCSDLIYFPELLAPLLRTLLQLTSPPFSSTSYMGATVVISYKLRSLAKETPFWSAFGLWFSFEPVLSKDPFLPEGSGWERFGASSDDTAFIFVGRRRPESFSWIVPVSDSDLLDGRGARGDDSAKGDDTFETLLFMTIHDTNL